MMQQNLFSQRSHPYSVSEITARIRTILERETAFQDLWVEGEVSNVSRPSSGHVYFTLKDSDAQLGAVVWRGSARRLSYLPRSGDQVLAHGKIGLYEQGGRYQIYVDFVQPAGRGSLFQEFERLKAVLEAEGLFAEEHKRPLPSFPRCIGVVTSPTAAAFRDVLNVLGRRYPVARILLSPTLVQGDAAPSQIVAALECLNARDDVDVILMVRGGGSLEDLWAFNDEQVARAVAASRLPVISGVGHETDFSLADFAADRRAPTPSAAAELATPDLVEVRAAIWQFQARMERAFGGTVDGLRRHLESFCRALDLLSPGVRLANVRQRVDDLAARADAALAHRMAAERQQVAALSSRLGALNPEAVLSRGYAIVRQRDSGELLTSAEGTAPGMALTLQLRDGDVPVVVEER